ncbi:hypothetical protein BGZ96_012022 [Linnemannia gamsii]|uniref:Uncharacterized protein n=1 Tax=Linnemannia gamsii TaxID=64522 RepID=A0ABQ7JS41_9FUNG|nr:hypothetical protein BGZ96_012022 [Linnemannia gamsii]
MDSDHTTYYTNRCLRKLALLDSEEALLLLNLKTPHISSTINHQRDSECLYNVRNTVLEYELSLQSLYPLVPNKQVFVEDGSPGRNTRSKRRRVTAAAAAAATMATITTAVATATEPRSQSEIRVMISPCDMSQRYKRKLNILDEEEQEFLGWGHKQDSPGLIACRQLIRKYETALVDFIQMQADLGPIESPKQ